MREAATGGSVLIRRPETTPILRGGPTPIASDGVIGGIRSTSGPGRIMDVFVHAAATFAFAPAPGDRQLPMEFAAGALIGAVLVSPMSARLFMAGQGMNVVGIAASAHRGCDCAMSGSEPLAHGAYRCGRLPRHPASGASSM